MGADNVSTSETAYLGNMNVYNQIYLVVFSLDCTMKNFVTIFMVLSIIAHVSTLIQRNLFLLLFEIILF